MNFISELLEFAEVGQKRNSTMIYIFILHLW